MPTVAALMHRGLVACRGDTPLGEVAELLVERRIHAVVVLGPDGRPAGLLSDTDLLAGEWLAADDETLATMRRMTAGELMSTPLATIDADADAAEAAARLDSEHLGRLVVYEAGAPLGVIVVSDLVAALARLPADRGTVADVMSRGFVACRPDTPASALARTMHERRSRSVVVLAPDGSPLGVVTGHDLLPLVGGEVDPPAEALMHAPLTIEPGASLREAADALLRHEVHRLLVVDPEDPSATPLGVLSTTDIVAEMAAPGSPWR